MKPLEVEIYLDGARPTLYDSTPTSVAAPKKPHQPLRNIPSSAEIRPIVYANGFSGEKNDYFPTRCLGVDVTLKGNPPPPPYPFATPYFRHPWPNILIFPPPNPVQKLTLKRILCNVF